MSIRNMDDLARMSTAVAKSGMFRDGRNALTPPQVAVKLMFAMAMGFEPISGLTGVDIIEGNPTPNGHFWAAALESHPDYDYDVEEHTAERCTIAFFRRRDGEWRRRGSITWTIEEDAKRAQLAGKDNWKKYPRAMLWNRAMTEGGKAYCPQLFGGVRAYVPEEMGVTAATPEEVAMAAADHIAHRPENVRGEPAPAPGGGLPVDTFPEPDGDDPFGESVEGEVVIEGQASMDLGDEANAAIRGHRDPA